MGQKILPRSAFAEHEKRAAKLRKHCIDFVAANVKGKNCYSLLSGGVDSHMCLFAALAAGKKPIVLSFTLDGRESRDFRTARNTAAYYGLEFRPVVLKPTLDNIKRHVWDVNHKYLPEFHINKSTIECTWPLAAAMDEMKSGPFLLGFGGDPPYASSRKQKKAWMAGEHDKLLKLYYDNRHFDLQVQYMTAYAAMHKKKLAPVMPLNDAGVYKIFTGMDPFKQGNKPIQKAPSRLAFFEYFEPIQVFCQQSFQKGDTGIGDSFNQLLSSDWNLSGYKSVVGVFNDVERKDLPKPY